MMTTPAQMARALQRARIPVPADAALPMLPALLDAERFAAWTRRSIGIEPQNPVARSLRYKPGKRAVVLYEASLAGRPTWAVLTAAARKDMRALAASPEARRIADAARPRCASPEPIHVLDRAGAMVEWYPARIDLPGLTAVPERVRELSSDGKDHEPHLLVYRPVQRAVLRADGLYLKAYVSPVRFTRAVEGLTLASEVPGFRTPLLVGAYPDERLTVQRAIAGEPLPDAPVAWRKLGAALARLHASALHPSRRILPEDHLEVGRKAGAHVSAIVPRLATRVAALLERLAAAQPPPSAGVPSHGDFYERQALATDDDLALLDFDSISTADPAFDLSRLAAHDVYDTRDLRAAMARLEDTLTGYGRRPDALDWYLAVAILRRTTHPLRTLRPDWPSRIEGMLEASEEVAP